MKTIDIIEIDEDGPVSTACEYQFDFLPCIDERIILPEPNGEQKLYKVLDVHHIPNAKTTIYVMADYRTLTNVLHNIAKRMGWSK